MDIIHLLPDSVANQIAAGEVIQRPASVIKELVENAIDAGAHHITVNVEDAGKTLIQVIDDGHGMSETDARMAFERHATSKIQRADDLFALHTMGFRGEALASIAAVAQVELRSRQSGYELGTQLTIEGSRVVSQQMTACQQGSNFIVRNLFFNVPARRKFLKSNQTELNNIMQEMERMTLVNGDISFMLSHNGQLLLDLPAAGKLQRIVSVFGRKLGDVLLPLDVETSMCRITGFVGKPESAKKKGAHQFFFVNNRYMRHPYFHKAIVEAFSHYVAPDAQVPYFIYFDVNPADIDVNIHPTKTEIKFENEFAIWQILSAAVRESLGSFNAIPTIDFDNDGSIDIPAFVSSDDASRRFVQSPDPMFDPEYNPFDSPRRGAPSRPSAPSAVFESDRLSRPSADIEQSVLDLSSDDKEMAVERSVNNYQYKGQYILTAVKSGLMIVDQHRAHVRILYEQYRAQMVQHKCATQSLLFPEMVTLSAADSLLIDEIMEPLADVGFDISSLGGGSYSVNGVPSGLETADTAAVIHGILTTIREQTGGVEEDVSHRLALEMARRQAVQVGEVLGTEEMESLLGKLFACQVPNYTPNGQLVIKIIAQSDIEEWFK